MSDAKKTHRITLGKHSEEVTTAELAQLKEKYGPRFAQYDVEEINAQPAKPSEGPVVADPEKKSETQST